MSVCRKCGNHVDCCTCPPTLPPLPLFRKLDEPRGFAALTPEQRKANASKGGKARAAAGTGHVWTSDEAREAGRKGGAKTSQDKKHMAEIGAKGGHNRAQQARDYQQAVDFFRELDIQSKARGKS